MTAAEAVARFEEGTHPGIIADYMRDHGIPEDECLLMQEHGVWLERAAPGENPAYLAAPRGKPEFRDYWLHSTKSESTPLFIYETADRNLYGGKDIGPISPSPVRVARELIKNFPEFQHHENRTDPKVDTPEHPAETGRPGETGPV